MRERGREGSVGGGVRERWKGRGKGGEERGGGWRGKGEGKGRGEEEGRGGGGGEGGKGGRDEEGREGGREAEVYGHWVALSRTDTLAHSVHLFPVLHVHNIIIVVQQT